MLLLRAVVLLESKKRTGLLHEVGRSVASNFTAPFKVCVSWVHVASSANADLMVLPRFLP